MYADRYDKRRQINPGSAMLALAINGAILGGLVLFANPTFKQTFEKHLIAIAIPLDPVQPPPPPPPPRPQPHEKMIKPAQHDILETTKPVIVTKLADPTPIPQPTFTPTIIDGGTVGTGGGTLPLKPTPPVLTDPLVDPRYRDSFQPVFPPDEQRMGHAGRVVVRVLVGVDGRVKDIERVSATSDSFFETTRRRALDKWRFKPGTKDGIPIEAWRQIAVSFVLNEE